MLNDFTYLLLVGVPVQRTGKPSFVISKLNQNVKHNILLIKILKLVHFLLIPTIQKPIILPKLNQNVMHNIFLVLMYDWKTLVIENVLM
jgi:hypothetical protein